MARSRMKNCKACGNEIAKNAKVCPHCGAKNKKNNWWVGIIILAVLVWLILTISDTGKKEIQKNKIADAQARTEYAQEVADNLLKETSTPKPIPKTEFGIGEKAELKNIVCSLVSVSESEGSTYNKPTEGNVFVLCEFEIENNTNSEISISSLLSFDAYCDDYACNFSLSAIMEKGNRNQLDGTIAAGKKFNGVVGYEIPSDWAELEIHFKPDYWSGKEFVFVANHNW